VSLVEAVERIKSGLRWLWLGALFVSPLLGAGLLLLLLLRACLHEAIVPERNIPEHNHKNRRVQEDHYKMKSEKRHRRVRVVGVPSGLVTVFAFKSKFGEET